jgi:hypothetical protein
MSTSSDPSQLRDPLLAERAAVHGSADPAALARSRAAALAALAAAGTARPWQRRALLTTLLAAAVTTIGALVVGILHDARGVLRGRELGLVLLGAAQVVGLWFAIAPGRQRAAVLGWVAAAAGAALVLSGRGPAVVGEDSGWLCAASHLAVGAVPLVIVASALRDGAFSVRRSASAGLALGTAGMIWGEIACTRGLAHVITQHVGAWLLVTAAAVALTRALRPRSFAP